MARHDRSMGGISPVRRASAYRAALVAGLLCCPLLAALPSAAPRAADAAGAASVSDAAHWNSVIAGATAAREAGELDSSIDALERAAALAIPAEARVTARAELGATLFAAHRYEEAGGALRDAYAASHGVARARVAIDLGNLELIHRHDAEARAYFSEALALSGGDVTVRLAAELGGARLAPSATRLVLLAALAQRINGVTPRVEARYRLNLGEQARLLGAAGTALAYANFEQGRRQADASGDARLQIESRDALAALYEAGQRDRDALRLTRAALAIAAPQPAARVADLVIGLEWREARLLEAHGNPDAAIAAYRRAVEQIEAVRQDIPIDYQDGRSSYSATLAPVYQGLVNLLLRDADSAPPARASADLERAREVLESLRQAEMQDYLGDRCTVESLQGANSAPAEGTAFLYPVILPDRLEMLLQSASGTTRATTHIGGVAMARILRTFAQSLRSNAPGYLRDAALLYDWILRPFDDTLATQNITTLVVVSDGALRLIPVGALYDGQHFAIEKYAVATVTGLSMTNATAPDRRQMHALVAGMSVAGPVVERLRAQQELQREEGSPVHVDAPVDGAHGATRALPTLLLGGGANAARERDERDELALPGVREEVQALTRTLNATSLLDARFTAQRFSDEAGSGEYRIVHVASHGYFGGDARDSYILAFDDLVTLEDLQELLKSDRYRQQPIELLSLSACETAEGNERSPLGMAGAAMKARAKSVLGTLWPVEDDAARAVMERFYATLDSGRSTKAQALRDAQLQLLRDPRTATPFFWAPFVLVGNWL